jgi:hypothetical protein
MLAPLRQDYEVIRAQGIEEIKRRGFSVGENGFAGRLNGAQRP